MFSLIIGHRIEDHDSVEVEIELSPLVKTIYLGYYSLFE